MKSEIRHADIAPIPSGYDVAVCGGGPAGIIAAAAAARNGARTILIERYGFLGGMATLSLVSPLTTFSKNGKRIIGGIPMEFCEAMEKLGGADTGYPSGRVPFDPEVFKLAAQRMTLGFGAALLLHSYISGCVMDTDVPGRVKGIVVHNKSGRQEIRAGYFIDCTGDADVVKLAGLPYRAGEGKDKELQPMTLWFRLGGVDTDHLENMEMCYENVRSVNLRVRDALTALGPDKQVPVFGGPWILTTLRKGEATINMTRFAGNGTNVISLTQAECALREDVFRLAALLKENFAEFRDSYLLDTGTQAGIRETRRIEGLYEMTAEDIFTPRDFPDAVARGGHPIDIHKADSSAQDLRLVEESYRIPYRSMIPKGADNLIVAGRSISADREAFASIRVMSTAMALGQAAGTAAALCGKQALPVHALDAAELRSTLKEQGAIL